MGDCTICLEAFGDDDEVVIYGCDGKHYYHVKCGMEWLENKFECPLCRKNFRDEVNRFVKNKEAKKNLSKEEAAKPLTESEKDENEILEEMNNMENEMHNPLGMLLPQALLGNRQGGEQIIIIGPNGNVLP